MAVIRNSVRAAAPRPYLPGGSRDSSTTKSLWRTAASSCASSPAPARVRTARRIRPRSQAMHMLVRHRATAPRRHEQIFAAQHDEADMGSLARTAPRPSLLPWQGTGGIVGACPSAGLQIRHQTCFRLCLQQPSPIRWLFGRQRFLRTSRKLPSPDTCYRRTWRDRSCGCTMPKLTNCFPP
jgi:hypothetical protein